MKSIRTVVFLPLYLCVLTIAACNGEGMVTVTGEGMATVTGEDTLDEVGFCDDEMNADICERHLWSMRSGDDGWQSGRSVAVDGEGSVFVTEAFGGAGSGDPYVAKFDGSGNYMWRQSFGGTERYTSQALAVDGSGNLFVSGEFEGTMFLGEEELVSVGDTGASLYVAKLDGAGNFLWSKVLGGAASDIGFDLTVDGAGNVFVTGSFLGTTNLGGEDLVGVGGSDLFLAKFDGAGSHLWSQRFGDSGSQFGFGLAVDGDGSVFVTGTFGGAINLGGENLMAAGSALYVAKFAGSGSHLWSQSFDGIQLHLFGESIDIDVDGEGDVFVIGDFEGMINLGGEDLVSAGLADLYVAKFDGAGNHAWSMRAGDPGSQSGTGLAVDGGGDVFITGSFGGTINLGGDDLVADAGSVDLYVAKLDGSGGHLWSMRAGDGDSQYGSSLAVDGAGDVFVAGGLEGTMNLGGAILVSAGSTDMFLAKLKG